MALVVAVAAGVLVATSGEARADDDGDWRLYDAGVLLSAPHFDNGYPIELAIQNFTSGTPAVRWSDARLPIEVCTHQSNRPAWITAELFRDAVRQGAEMWNRAGAAVGYRYTGDCASGVRWQDANGVNEIGFDDSRNEVRFPAAAVTKGTWRISPGQRNFSEINIIIHRELDVPEVCFRSVIAHELGHGLGYGHSDNAADLMYATFNAADPRTCPLEATARERTWLVGLYGSNSPPIVDQMQTQTVAGGTTTTLSVSARDPNGGSLTYRWTQVAGPTVTLSGSGSSVTFVAPRTAGAELRFRVDVFDRYMATTSATAVAVVSDASAAPAGVPSLQVIGAATGGRTGLEWNRLSGATAYEFCTTPTGSSSTQCTTQSGSLARMTWPTVLGVAGSPSDRRVIATGTRETALSACNASGCSPAGVGPHLGGVQWAAWDVDYDVFAMRFDVPQVGLRFTIAGVVNLQGPPRRFTLYSGTDQNPMQRRILSCGNVPAGQTCIGLLNPHEGGHTALATITSERAGTPLIEHRIRIR